MTKPRILDLFCCAGGAGVGYSRAGFDVVGVDIDPQPRYPFEFHQGDAVALLARLVNGEAVQFGSELLRLSDFAAIHASPPRQSYLSMGAVNRALGREYDHPDLVGVTRELLIESSLPYVIENVEGSPLEAPVRICGTGMFMPIRRHRLFESNLPLEGIACAHGRYTVPKYWTGWRPKGEHRLSTVVQVYGNAGGREHWPAAMGIDWMSAKEMTEAIPPAYTEHIGRQLIQQLASVPS